MTSKDRLDLIKQIVTSDSLVLPQEKSRTFLLGDPILNPDKLRYSVFMDDEGYEVTFLDSDKQQYHVSLATDGSVKDVFRGEDHQEKTDEKSKVVACDIIIKKLMEYISSKQPM